MRIFSANEVVAKVDGLNTVKTLHRWRRIVEEHYGADYFYHDAIDPHPSMIEYSDDDIQRFQTVAYILSEQPCNRKNLRQAIMTAFASEKPFVMNKTAIEVLEDKFDCRMNDLSNENKHLQTAIYQINYKLTMIEQQLSSEKERKSKLFRRK